MEIVKKSSELAPSELAQHPVDWFSEINRQAQVKRTPSLDCKGAFRAVPCYSCDTMAQSARKIQRPALPTYQLK